MIMKGLEEAGEKLGMNVSRSELKVFGKEMRDGLKTRSKNYSSEEYVNAFSNRFGATTPTEKVIESTEKIHKVDMDNLFSPKNIKTVSVPEKNILDDVATSSEFDRTDFGDISKHTNTSQYKNRPETSSNKRTRKTDPNGMGEAIHPEAKGYLNAATTPPGPKSLERLKFEKLGLSKAEDFKIGRVEKKYDAHISALDSEAGRTAVGKEIGVDGSKLSKEEMLGNVHSYHSKKLAEKASTMDHVLGNNYHTKAAGGLITAGVVGSLFNSRGQQSNAQLYNQAPGPGQ